MVIIDKTKHECKIIDFASPFNSKIEEREKINIKSYKRI